jgi:hypothetical protein
MSKQLFPGLTAFSNHDKYVFLAFNDMATLPAGYSFILDVLLCGTGGFGR